MNHQLAMQGAEMRKGPWLEEEDERLISVVDILGDRRWDALAKASGLRRSGKSCRLRWMNYLRPNLKHGPITAEEEQLIIQLHKQWGNRWSRIAQRLPGRTDNEIKNYWRSHLRKKALVIEQEYSCSNVCSLQNSVTEMHDTGSPCSINGDCSSEKEDNLGNSAKCANALELSSLGLVFSPYETRLTDWLSNLPNEQQAKIEHNGESCNTDASYYHPEWISGYSSTSIWDGSLPIWDMD